MFNFSKSDLYNEHTFYPAFLHDLEKCRREVIIESPYITSLRMETFYPIFKRILDRGIKIHVITRDPIEHNEEYKYQATEEILQCAEMGINMVLLRGYHHRKIAIIDRKILWEGSLNILSQVNSIEVMSRIEEKRIAKKMMNFLKLNRL